MSSILDMDTFQTFGEPGEPVKYGTLRYPEGWTDETKYAPPLSESEVRRIARAVAEELKPSPLDVTAADLRRYLR